MSCVFDNRRKAKTKVAFDLCNLFFCFFFVGKSVKGFFEKGTVTGRCVFIRKSNLLLVHLFNKFDF